MAGRAVIRRARAADAAAVAALRRANRDYFAPWEPDAPDPERAYTDEGVRAWLTDGADRFVILDGGAIAGMTALTSVQRGPLQSAMISYFVDRGRAGRGLATAAVDETVAFAFERLGLHRVEAGTATANVASQRVLEKARFTRVGVLRQHLLIGGEWVDHVLWERLVGD
ncbi:MAG TPA: GNAT family protein [Gaiellaceae bacterium]|nr:GNAT family protein [Gaiellaceae bacterium]